MGSNINGAGMNLTQFARVLFFDAIAYGKGHVLVEFPSKDNGEESESDQAAAGKLPWFTPITATDLIGWTESITASGEVVLDEIRFREQETVAAGTYRQKAREVIRVVRADGTWEKWSRDLKGWAAAGGYALEASGEHTFPGIPLVTLYTNWTANLCARPPLLDLAWLNAAHYRALSRQLWHEEHLKTPVFLRAGWSDDELRGGIDLGASEGIDTGNENGKASWVEASGSSAQIGRDGLRALEERAEVLGLQHMVSRTGDVRATAVAVDEAKSDNNVQAYLRGAELALRQAFELASQFVGVELDEDFGVDIWSEFPIEARAATDIPFLLQMRRERVISHETALREIRRRGLIDAKLDLGAEVDAVGREGPPLSRVGEPEASAFNFNGR
jgi:hypothetical protein